jgi:hypothetical protein
MFATAVTARRYALLLAATSGLMLLAQPAAAEEESIRCKLVTQPVEKPTALPEIGGHKVSATGYVGVATCADGRIAHKRFVDMGDDTADAGTFLGYSTYTFENGDSLTLGYTGTWDTNGARGDYKLISGTGKYAGATGTGSFNGLEEPWDEASLFDITLNITLATQ